MILYLTTEDQSFHIFTDFFSQTQFFGMSNAATQLPEFEQLIRVLSNWSEYILNAFDCGFTNGFTEGCNNKIKVLKRIAFGYRSFKNMRQRILLTANAT